MLNLLRHAFREFNDDECPIRAAALAYYTIFALPPLLILLLLLAGMVWDPRDIQRAMGAQFSSLVGAEGGRTIQQMLSSAKRPGSGGIIATILGTGGLVIGAIGAFMQLQSALNRAWDVMPDPAQRGIKRFIGKRMLSIGMLLGVAFLLIVSLAMSALVSALGKSLTFFPESVAYVVDFALSFTVMTALFAAIFKVLPDAEVEWRDVWVGALGTSILFVIGKLAIGLYLGRSAPGSAFGAAGALAVILVWIYYAGMIVLFGAEFTQAWAERAGRRIRPEKGAVRVERAPLRAHQRPDAQFGARATARNEKSEHEHSHNPPAEGRAAMERSNNSAGNRIRMHDGNGRAGIDTSDEQSIGDLFKRLTSDSSYLIRQEINLAKTEMKETGTRLGKTASKLAIALGLAIPGALAIAAFLVIALGNAIENYWASALIVGVVLLGLAGILAQRALAAISKGKLGLPDTATTLRDDAQWAKEEVRTFKREVRA